MRCEEVMKTNVECVSVQDTVQAAARRMRDRNLGFLPVCDRSEKVVGTVTDRDLAIRVLADAKAATTPLADVLTQEVVMCRPQDDLRKAQELMVKHRKSRIMCVDDEGRIAGIISLSDIAQRASGDGVAATLRGVTQREARA